MIISVRSQFCKFSSQPCSRIKCIFLSTLPSLSFYLVEKLLPSDFLRASPRERPRATTCSSRGECPLLWTAAFNAPLISAINPSTPVPALPLPLPAPRPPLTARSSGKWPAWSGPVPDSTLARNKGVSTSDSVKKGAYLPLRRVGDTSLSAGGAMSRRPCCTHTSSVWS